MEALPLVKKLLADDEKCLISVRAGLVDNGKKISKYLVIVNRAGDKAVLIFSTTQVPCSEISQLSVMETIPINKEFSYKQESEVLVEISNNQKRLRFDLSASQTVALCKELKQAKETVTHVVGFGLPSSFSWLDKYTNKAPEKNLFETDVFDPLKYMNIEDNGKKAQPPLVKSHQEQGNLSLTIQEEFDPLKPAFVLSKTSVLALKQICKYAAFISKLLPDAPSSPLFPTNPLLLLNVCFLFICFPCNYAINILIYHSNSFSCTFPISIIELNPPFSIQYIP
eukprot:XP_014774614.1 PREDICTED: uncharacterized protein LOC106872219 [Octopus bimaculoides]